MATRVRLAPVDAQNWEDVAHLEVRDDQAEFLTPNVFSIAESKFHPELQPLAIYDGPRLIGFAMYARDPADNNYWLYRFMIDRRYQGKGYGKAALRLLLDRLRELPGCAEVNVGYHRENIAAERLYLALGFEKTGVAPWGEQTARVRWDEGGRDS
ncbi:MAG TPA: GNAT family N-acetyltransferase [Thermomicrobiales bacterium]|nr:GNAT family N-acetyltransferase [Thermomicrobiales bacterium]